MIQWQRVIILILLSLVFSACSVITISPVPFPPQQVLQQAIELQLSQSQQGVTQHLSHHHPATPSLKMSVNRVKISRIKPMTIQGLPSFEVQGFYNLQINRQTKKIEERRNPFDIYLQSQKQGQTWRLARRYLNSHQTQPQWLTYLIQ